MRSHAILYIKRDQTTLNFGQDYREQLIIRPSENIGNSFNASQRHLLRMPWRILFASDAVYTLTLSIPPHIQDIEAFISQQLQSEIPEELEKNDWGYTLRQSKEERQATVFIPLPDFWDPIRNFIVSNNLSIEAITTESLASKNATNLLLGAAQASLPPNILRRLLPTHNKAAYRIALTILAVVVSLIILVVVINIMMGGIT